MSETMLRLFDGISEDELEEWTPTDVASVTEANQLVGTMMLAEERMHQVEQMRQQAIDMINARAEALLAKEEKKLERGREALEPWVRQMIERNKEIDPKAKRSIDLLWGTAGYRKGRDKVELVEFGPEEAKKLEIPVQVKEYVNKTDVLNYIKKTGQVPDGVEVTEADDKFYVKVKGGE
jgi:hypothetical protein